jgi:cytochrome c-type biogenesis protein CcmF
MIVYNKHQSALKASLLLVLVTYILILYSTFLTRSGVLGETSVHSFTDLGLSGQLLIFLAIYLIGSTVLLVRKWKHIPTTKEEVSMYSREFWIFMGATVLALMSFQVFIPTSIPVWNEIMAVFGVDSNIAPPADQVGFYTKFQLWFAILLALLSGTGQFFYWKKMDPNSLKKEIQWPVVISLLLSSLIFLVASIREIGLMLLLTASVYSLVANSSILLRLKKGNFKLAGGSVTHIGVALMLIGILFSSGYSKILSKNNTGLLWSKEFPDEVNQNNLLLFQNEPRQMADYSLIYRGVRRKTKELGYVDAQKLSLTNNPLKLRVKANILNDGEIIAKVGDTLTLINSENSYFEVIYEKANGREFTLFPRVQMNEAMGVVYSPDINRTATADLYTHVRTFPDPEQDTKWSEDQVVEVTVGENFFVNDYVATFKEMSRVNDIPGVTLSANDVAVKAVVEVQGEYETYTAEPIYVIKDRMAGRIPYVLNDLAAKLTIDNISPESNSFSFIINTTQKDWIILEAVEKPWINILWTGTFLLVIGFTIAIIRRYDEFVKMRDKQME